MSNFNLCQFLLETSDEFNGHKQTTINGLSFDDLLLLCKDLEEYVDNSNVFYIKYYSDSSYSVYQSDYWEEKEHHSGATDRLILSSS